MLLMIMFISSLKLIFVCRPAAYPTGYYIHTFNTHTGPDTKGGRNLR